jgi:hypothetical protein
LDDTEAGRDDENAATRRRCSFNDATRRQPLIRRVCWQEGEGRYGGAVNVSALVTLAGRAFRAENRIWSPADAVEL